jgi:biopolymer transport protein ExbD
MYEVAKKKPGDTARRDRRRRKAPYGVIIRILDAAKEAGLQDVGFVTS